VAEYKLEANNAIIWYTKIRQTFSFNWFT
jgi:hypothetical protein